MIFDSKFYKNYITTVIQKIKIVIAYALDEGKHTNLEFKKNIFQKFHK